MHYTHNKEKYDKGDYVLVAKSLFCAKVKNWPLQWVPAMESMVGKIYKIAHCDLKEDRGFLLQKEDSYEEYWFPSSALKQIKPSSSNIFQI